MKLDFHKFHGNGNDFILIDNLTKPVNLTAEQIARICHRRFGVGADGLIEINPSATEDFSMKYYNADGYEGTMCGNGGRCAAAFAHLKGYVSNKMRFEAIDGFHLAEIERELKKETAWHVAIQLRDVSEIKPIEGGFYIDTGSPHVVLFTDHLDNMDVFKEGKKIRESADYNPDGVNVNFVKVSDEVLKVRTFERGVEDETLSCGTGVTAAAIAASRLYKKNSWQVITSGGDFQIDFEMDESKVWRVWLRGPAELICSGMIKLD